MNLFSSPSDKVAVLDSSNTSYSYSDLYLAADAFILRLPIHGLVFNLCLNHIESLHAYVGLLRDRRFKQTLLSPQLNSELLQNLVNIYSPNVVILPSSRSDQLLGYMAHTSTPALNILVRTTPNMTAIHEELAVLLPTSGSTGSPKLVKLSYENLESNARAIANYLEIVETDRAITTLPMNYAFGLSIINSHLLAGASVVLNEFSITEKNFWNLLTTTSSTTFGGVPYTYEILKKFRFEKMSTPTLRYLTQAGGKLSEDLVKYFSETAKAKGLRFIVMYGQTEATARMSYLPWEQTLSKPSSIGIAIPGGKFRLINDAGEDVLTPGVTGELVYEGKNVCFGYATNRDDLSLGDKNLGLLRTNDLAKKDADGYYYIVGRLGRQMKIFGNRIDLDEVEQLLLQIGVSGYCISHLDNLVVFSPQHTQSLEIKNHISELINLNSRFIEVYPIEEVPRNENGKIQYKELEHMYLAGKNV